MSDTNWNWWKFLTNTDPSEEEWQEARNRARAWPTCACGEQCKTLPKDILGGPDDGLLRTFGMEFMRFIHEKDQAAALNAFRAIENRSAYLLLLQKR